MTTDLKNRHNNRLYTRREVVCGIGMGLASLLLAGSFSGCSCSKQPQTDPDVWVWKYDWNALRRDAKDRFYYYPDGKLASKLGIDVSELDQQLDWDLVAGDGIEFAIVRVGYRGYTEGGMYLDKYFQANVDGARKNHIPLGVYFFSAAISEKEAVEEAQFVIDALGGHSLDLPVFYDQEQVSYSAARHNNLATTQYSKNAIAFCERIKQAGYKAMVYGNQHHLGMLSKTVLETYPIWYAEYGVFQPTGHFDFDLWQFAASRPVEGAPAGCDLNIMFANL